MIIAMHTRTVLLSLVAVSILSIAAIGQEPPRPQIVAGRSKVATCVRVNGSSVAGVVVTVVAALG